MFSAEEAIKTLIQKTLPDGKEFFLIARGNFETEEDA